MSPAAAAVAQAWALQRPAAPDYSRRDSRLGLRLAAQGPQSPFGEPTGSGVTLIAHFEKRWKGVLAATAELSAADTVELDCSGPWTHLVVVLKEAGASMQAHAAGVRNGGGPSDAPHRMYLVPPETAFCLHAKGQGYVRLLSLQFCAATLTALIGNDFQPDLPLLPRMAFLDDRVFALAGLIESECRRLEPTSSVLASSLSVSLLSLLASLEPGATPVRFSGGLTGRQLNAVKRYLEEHLPERVDPVALARLARLSTSHFHRAFKTSTGMPPHAWLTNLRIQRAKALLAVSETSLAEIALDTGFTDQPHFTRVFTRLVGVTPGAFRRSIAG